MKTKLLIVAGLLAVVVAVGFWERPESYFFDAIYLREWLTGVQSRSVQVTGHRVHYLAEGPVAGPVVVLVHGLSGQAEDWRNLAPYLAKAGFRIYMPDLPGYGRSEQPADFSYSVPDEAAVVVGFLDSLGLKQVELGGWSMGGWIVQQVAAQHPDRVSRLILIDSAGLAVKPDWDTRLFTPTTPAELDQLEALLTPHPSMIPGFVARDILRISKKNAWVIHRALDSMLSGKDATDNLLPGLKMPLLLIWGAEDRITPLSLGQTMQALVPQSQLDIYPGCGHMAPEQCAARIAPTLVAFAKQ
jgi:pimeloyl-ACP methyl ester carboxylesterase